MPVVDYRAVFYAFKPGALLQSYLAKKTFFRLQFTLGKLLTVLQIIIYKEKFIWCPPNPTVIMWFTEVEKALHIRALFFINKNFFLSNTMFFSRYLNHIYWLKDIPLILTIQLLYYAQQTWKVFCKEKFFTFKL